MTNTPQLRSDFYTRFILTAIAVFLGILALRPAAEPLRVFAESEDKPSPYYIEPGIVALRKPDGSAQGQGKMVVDRRTGDIWGFPTANLAPYPMDPIGQKPATSRAVYLGRFDLSSMKKY